MYYPTILVQEFSASCDRYIHAYVDRRQSMIATDILNDAPYDSQRLTYTLTATPSVLKRPTWHHNKQEMIRFYTSRHLV